MGVNEELMRFVRKEPPPMLGDNFAGDLTIVDADFQLDTDLDYHDLDAELVVDNELPEDYLDRQIKRVDGLINDHLAFTTFLAQQIEGVRLTKNGIPLAPTWAELKNDVVGGTASFHVLDKREVFYQQNKTQLIEQIKMLNGVVSCSEVMGAIVIIIDTSTFDHSVEVYDNPEILMVTEKMEQFGEGDEGMFISDELPFIFVDINPQKYQPSDDGSESVLRHELYHYLVDLIKNFLVQDSLQNSKISEQDYLSGLMEVNVSNDPDEIVKFLNILKYEQSYLDEINSRFSTYDFPWFGGEIIIYSTKGKGFHWALLGCQENIPLGKNFLYLMQRLIAIKIELDTLTGVERPQEYQVWEAEFIDSASWVMEMVKFTLAASQSLHQAYRQLDQLRGLIEIQFPQIIPEINETVMGWK